MQLSDLPTKIPTPWGALAGAGFIRVVPIDSQIGIEDGAASFQTGFPPDCFANLNAGGVPPFGQDANGIFSRITQWLRWSNAGGVVQWDADFAAAVGGYPIGSILRANSANVGTDYFWLSLQDSNTGDPDAGAGGWQAFSVMGQTTGDMKFRPTAETLPFYVRANALRIGNPASNANERANADTFALFGWVWREFSNTQCPVVTSGGAGTTRGLTAAADFAANKSIVLPDFRTVGQKGVDGMGNSNTNGYVGVRVVSGNAIIPGSVLGGNVQTLVVGEIPAIIPAGTLALSTSVSITDLRIWRYRTDNTATGSDTTTATAGPTGIFNNEPVIDVSGSITAAATPTGTFTGTSFGGGGNHDNTDLSMLGTFYLKL